LPIWLKCWESIALRKVVPVKWLCEASRGLFNGAAWL
jgi:hypothetical protein